MKNEGLGPWGCGKIYLGLTAPFTDSRCEFKVGVQGTSTVAVCCRCAKLAMQGPAVKACLQHEAEFFTQAALFGAVGEPCWSKATCGVDRETARVESRVLSFPITLRE